MADHTDTVDGQLVVEELVVPATMDDDPELVRAFSDWLAVSDAAEVAVHGLPELPWTPAEYLPMCHEPGSPSRLFVVRDDTGDVVAAGSYDSKTEPGTTNCWLSVGVRPDRQRRGSARCSPTTSSSSPGPRAARSGRRTRSRGRSVPATGPGTARPRRAPAPSPRTRRRCAS